MSDADAALGARILAALRAALAADCEADLSIALIGDRGAVRVVVDGVYTFHPDFAAATADLEQRVADTIAWWEAGTADRLRAEQTAALHRAAGAALLNPSTAPASAIDPVPTWAKLAQAARAAGILRTIDEMDAQHANITRK